ncbi:small ribosomal subunit protein bS18m-like [Carassius carassius]|uniref:small ribosomal subunit protein bS18m-like n=1 Tax=Carassius carassius TaxID=217509 RepID=UPI002868416F|nr:small ribosomal subunit protein bS18m-like [Carassius carassius]
MFALSFSRLLLQALPKQPVTPRATAQCLRSLTTSQQEPLKKGNMPIKIENPYKTPLKTCVLCNITVDFRNVQLLSQFISPHTGRIYGRHITGLCGRKQKEVSKAIKQARSIGFMSVTLKDPQFIKDPDICGIKHFE